MTHKIIKMAKPNASLHSRPGKKEGKAILCHNWTKRESHQVNAGAINWTLEGLCWRPAEESSFIREREHESGATPPSPSLSFSLSIPSPHSSPISSIPSLPITAIHHHLINPSSKASNNPLLDLSTPPLVSDLDLMDSPSLFSLSIAYTYPRAGNFSHLVDDSPGTPLKSLNSLQLGNAKKSHLVCTHTFPGTFPHPGTREPGEHLVSTWRAPIPTQL